MRTRWPMLRGTSRSVVAALVVAAAGSVAAARDPYQIKSLKGDATGGEGGWQIAIRYEVRIKDYNPQDQFELVFYATENGRRLVDEQGRPLEHVVPLRGGQVDKKGEARFVGRVVPEVFSNVGFNPKRVRLHAMLVAAGDNRPLAEKEAKLKVHKR